MSKIELSVLFKKIQKDDKKEVLEFHVQGDELNHSDELVQLAGNIAILEVKNSEAGKLPTEFTSIQRDSKKTVLKFNVRGDSDKQVIKLYPFAGRNVTLFLEASQMSIEEFEEQHEGVEYNINGDGTVNVTNGQMNMDELDDSNEVNEEQEDENRMVEEDDFPFGQEEKQSEDDLLE